MGFEDEVEQSLPRPCRQLVGRSKRTCELTSSIVPRGTPFHHWVELGFPPTSFGFANCSRGCSLSGPAELGAINPDAVHDHRQASRQRDDGLISPAVTGNLHCPGFEPGPFRRMHQHDLGGLVERRPHHLVSTARYGARVVSFAGLIPGARQSEHRPNRLGFAKAGGHIDGGPIGQRHHRPNARHRHQAPAHLIVPDNTQQASMQNADLLAQHPPHNEQRFN
jgi:hypothetical protein